MPEQSPFFHYNSCIDAQEIMRAHALAELHANDRFLTNFLGVLIDPKFFPDILNGKAGQVEPIPIPANWHADISEWAAALRAVDLSGELFTVVELGCGWGCWLNNTGVAARRSARKVRLIGIEGDLGHLQFAREACEVNGFTTSEVVLYHGIASARNGKALFPIQTEAGKNWGLQPIFDASLFDVLRSKLDKKYEVLPMISLEKISEGSARIDLLHIDIQGGEAELINDSLALLNSKVAYIVVGTHSREIEGRIFSVLREAGWMLEIERPAILSLAGGIPQVSVDGVQGWRNPRLLLSEP
ncbi:FkbM family methyltransferase [Bradyrhizobium sp. MOS002]|uniref:FkbM family methyltransferase n=1 Tax=Bradyrhizobium sp. MOS002 TaxID=2133947 RepID=UPI000D12378E|nr:FkbM family methyltransferase [Bradyrhizobium sp. MOS002]PSO23652.1 FkbM family methyltransferase [Bradyrhizobium sp. MOS002]